MPYPLLRPVRSLADVEANNRTLRMLTAHLDSSNISDDGLETSNYGPGSVTSEQAVLVIDDRDSRLIYSPAPQAADPAVEWYRYTNDYAFYNNTVTRGKGDLTTQTVEYVFEDTGITLIAVKSNDSGKIDVSVDGGSATIVDLYAASELYRQAVFTVSGLEKARHTIKVTCRSDKNAASSNYYFYLDGFRIGTPFAMQNLDITPSTAQGTGTTNANGYLAFDAVNLAPAGYSLLTVVGATLVTPDPDSGAANKPKIGLYGRYIYVWDGPALGTVTINVILLFIRKG